ncbi:MAG: hypothetical protein WD872_09075, partial [Pirellulaceae bacterium]
TGDLMTRGILDIEGGRLWTDTGLLRSVLLTVLIGGGAVILLQIDWLLGLLRESGAPRFAMFLDSGERGLLATPAMWEIYGDLADSELKEFFDQSERSVCLAACQPGEESWPSGQLQHGIWAHHLIEAFAGNAPLALERGTLLTARSLQKHLQTAVPPSLRATYAEAKRQSPWACGDQSSDWVLADLGEILKPNKGAAQFSVGQVTRISFGRKQTADLRRLAGFRKGYRIPDHNSTATEAFLAKIADEEIRGDIAALHDRLRAAFKFKRADIQISHSGDGAASIITPHFTYTVRVSQSADDSSEVVWNREVKDIKAPAQILSDAFAEVFGEMFDTVEFSPPAQIPLAELIDRVEQLGDDRLTLDYDPDITWCKLTIEGIAGEIRVTSRAFEIAQRLPQPPLVLLQSFFAIQRALIDTHDIGQIPFGD